MFHFKSNTLFQQGEIKSRTMSDDMLLNALERWRKKAQLTKVDMARLFRLRTSQNYTNWLARRSIPKEFYPHVNAILNAEGEEDATKHVAIEYT